MSVMRPAVLRLVLEWCIKRVVENVVIRKKIKITHERLFDIYFFFFTQVNKPGSEIWMGSNNLGFCDRFVNDAIYKNVDFSRSRIVFATIQRATTTTSEYGDCSSVICDIYCLRKCLEFNLSLVRALHAQALPCYLLLRCALDVGTRTKLSKRIHHNHYWFQGSDGNRSIAY